MTSEEKTEDWRLLIDWLACRLVKLLLARSSGSTAGCFKAMFIRCIAYASFLHIFLHSRALDKDIITLKAQTAGQEIYSRF